MAMFRQVAPHGIVNKQPMDSKTPTELMDELEETTKDPSALPDTATQLDGNIDQPQKGFAATESNLVSDVVGKLNMDDISKEQKEISVAVPGESTKRNESQEAPAKKLAIGSVDASIPEPVEAVQSEGKLALTVQELQSRSSPAKVDIQEETMPIYSTESTNENVDKETSKTKNAGPPSIVDIPDAATITAKTAESSNTEESIPKSVEELANPEQYPHPHTMEEAVEPGPGEAVAVAPTSEETILTHEEMSKITPAECPFLMNRE
jgi:hypothetical protein